MRSRNPKFSQPGEYIEGIHYQKVSLTKPNDIRNYEIRYFFNFFCQKCYNFIPFVFNLDPNVPNLEKFLHPDFDILASPVCYAAATTNYIQSQLNLTYYAAEHLGICSIALNTILKDIHVYRKPIVGTYFSSQLPVDKSKVEKLKNSVGLRHRDIQTNRIFVNKCRGGNFSYFLINGQYRVVPKPQGRNGFEHMFKTIRFLVDK